MKILIIVSIFPHVTDGGIGDYTYNLAKELYNENDEIVILTSDDPRIMKGDRFFKIYPCVESWSIIDYRTVSKIINEIKPDIVHIQHDTTSSKNKKFLLNFLPLFLRLTNKRIKIVITIHEFLEHRLRWKLRLLPMFIFSDRAIFVDRWDMEIAEKQFGRILRSKASHIPIASNIIPSPEDRLIPKPEIRKRLNLKEEDILLFYFGNISPQKGLGVLLDLFERLIPISEHIKLVVISNLFSKKESRTEYQKNILSKIGNIRFKERILTIESQDAKCLSRYMLASDIAVLPFTFGVSYQRGSFLACLAHGLPTVTTVNQKFYPSFIINGKDVLFVEKGDSNAFYEKVIALIRNEKMRKEIGRNAITFYNKHFSWHSIAKETSSLYQEIFS